MLAQNDFGSGYSGNYTIPTGASMLVAYINGPGPSGGNPDDNSASGGGGAGAKCKFVITGTLGGAVITLNIPNGGTHSTVKGANGNLPTGQSTMTFANGFQWICGSGEPGFGGNGQPGPGGRGGNVAVNGNVPSFVTSFGQFNLGASPGMDGTTRWKGYGGNEGDTGGGGRGAWRWPTLGEDGQGGYIHLEVY